MAVQETFMPQSPRSSQNSFSEVVNTLKIEASTLTLDANPGHRGSITSIHSIHTLVSAGRPSGFDGRKREEADTSPSSRRRIGHAQLVVPHELVQESHRFRRFWGLQGKKILSCMRGLVHSAFFSAGMFMLSFYVLFGDDLRLGFFGKDADEAFDGITISCIVLFTLELVITIIAVPDYFLSFFFLLDVISTISLILDPYCQKQLTALQPDLTFVWGAIIGHDSITPDEKKAGESAAGQSDYARAGRSSRVGTRVVRILRVFRLIRMVRMVKILSLQRMRQRERRHKVVEKMQGSKQVPTLLDELFRQRESEPGEGSDDFTNSGESRVGKKLSDRTTLWVIMLVLAMLIILPLLDPGGGSEDMMTSSAQFGVDVMHQAWHDFRTAPTKQNRLHWERQVLLYTYYHNYYAECPLDEEGPLGDCASDTIDKLCFLGYVNSNITDSFDLSNFHIQSEELDPDSTDWDQLFHSRDGDWTQNQYIVGRLPQEIKKQLARPWEKKRTVGSATITGVSLLIDSACPWRTFRPQEMVRYFPLVKEQDASEPQLLLLFDTTTRSVLEARLSMIRTVFIILALTIGALLFSADADNLVLHPIERMICKVELIRQNPLYAIKLGDEQNLREYKQDTFSRQAWGPLTGCGNALRALILGPMPDRHSHRSTGRRRSFAGPIPGPPPDKKTLETKILENTIIKLGYLLALGFGEAGTEIIGHNLHDSRGGVDATIPGVKVEAIYGYCQIKDFSVTTEVLQEKTMVFVNQVAEIVHRIVDEHLGAANKNVGEAFLLVWRVGLYEEELQSKIADLSIASFIQVMAAVTRNKQLAEYGSHPALLARCNNYRVTLGFGLHLGWAIEGAIGSEFKIEASYLSSHVNMAMGLETLTKYFNLNMLMSEALVRVCSKSFAYYFRVVDNVKLKGLKAPTRLFTVDLDLTVLMVDTTEKPRRHDWRLAAHRYRDRQHREGLKLEKLDNVYLVHDIFSVDRHIKRMRAAYPLEFFQEFEKGYVNFESGEWDVASSIFDRTVGMIQGIRDGPSQRLLEYMQIFDFKAPPQWPGYHDLHDRPMGEADAGMCAGR